MSFDECKVSLNSIAQSMNLIHPLDDTTFGKFTTFDQLNSQVSTNSQDFEPDKTQG